MIEQTKYQKLFSTPLIRFAVPDSAVLNAALLMEGERLRQGGAGATKSNRGGWHSQGNLFDDDAPAFRQVRDAAQDAVEQVTKKVNSAFDPERFHLKLFAWMNANPLGGYNAPHTHPGAHWSGVYYVSQPDVSDGSGGKIEFLDPRSDLPHWKLLEASTFRNKFSLRPNAGELIVFPSYLMHWVHPNEADEDRVTIAFNATFRKRKT